MREREIKIYFQTKYHVYACIYMYKMHIIQVYEPGNMRIYNSKYTYL